MAPTGEYVEANGLRVYHETNGEGEPLLLVHWTSSSWGSAAVDAAHMRWILPPAQTP